jgi:hypothetical protein
VSVLDTSAHWTASRPGSIKRILLRRKIGGHLIDAQEDARRSVPHIERRAARRSRGGRLRTANETELEKLRRWRAAREAAAKTGRRAHDDGKEPNAEARVNTARP